MNPGDRLANPGTVPKLAIPAGGNWLCINLNGLWSATNTNSGPIRPQGFPDVSDKKV